MKALLFGLVLLSASGLASAQAAGGAGPVETQDRMVHDGRTRTALIHDFSGGRPAPLVIVLHGAGGNGEITVAQTQFDAVAKREGLIVAYPNGTGRFSDKLLTWNAGHCCAYAMRNHVDDVGYISALIDHLEATHSVDPRRVYVTGLSNGGMLAHRVGMALAGKVAAIAPVVGALFGDEPAAKAPLPVMIVLGGEDRFVPGEGGEPGLDRFSEGGEGGGRFGRRRLVGRAGPPSDRPFAPASAQAAYWAGADHCQTSARRTDGPVSVVSYSGCADGTEVLSYTIADNGHAWPGGRAPRDKADPPSASFNASEAIWAFFSRHPRSG